MCQRRTSWALLRLLHSTRLLGNVLQLGHPLGWVVLLHPGNSSQPCNLRWGLLRDLHLGSIYQQGKPLEPHYQQGSGFPLDSVLLGSQQSQEDMSSRQGTVFQRWSTPL